MMPSSELLIHRATRDVRAMMTMPVGAVLCTKADGLIIKELDL